MNGPGSGSKYIPFAQCDSAVHIELTVNGATSQVRTAGSGAGSGSG